LLVLGLVEWSKLAPPYHVIKIVKTLQHLPIEKIFWIVMNVELHWYIINTVYIGYQFSNILFKKCKGLIIAKIITFSWQHSYHKKLRYLLLKFKGSVRWKQRKIELRDKFPFQFLYVAKFVLKKKRFLANDTTGFSSGELTKLIFIYFGHKPEHRGKLVLHTVSTPLVCV
jgi:hypothetical protein